jgi:hypothetical protein
MYSYSALLKPVIPEGSRSRDFAMYYLGALGISQSRNFYYDWAYYIRGKLQDHPYITMDGNDPDPGYLDRQLVSRNIGRIPPYTYPPIWYIFCLPLLVFSWEGAFDVFLILNQIFLTMAILCLFRNQIINISSSGFLLLSGLVLYFFPVIRTVSGGQVNLLILLLISCALYSLKNKRDIHAGILLALATAIKMHPVLLIGYCALRKRYVVVLSALLCFIVLMGFSTLVVGLEVMQVYYLEVLPKWASNLRAHDMNISIAGFISRLFVGYKWLSAPFNNPGLARILISISSITTLLFLVILFFRRSNLYHNVIELEFSLVIIATALISTWTLDHHLVLLLIPYSILISNHRTDRINWKKTIFLITTYTLISWRYHYWEEFYRQGWPTLLLSIRTLGLAGMFIYTLIEYFEKTGSESWT